MHEKRNGEDVMKSTTCAYCDEKVPSHYVKKHQCKGKRYAKDKTKIKRKG